MGCSFHPLTVSASSSAVRQRGTPTSPHRYPGQLPGSLHEPLRGLRWLLDLRLGRRRPERDVDRPPRRYGRRCGPCATRAAVRLARNTFREQLSKGGLDVSRGREARLHIVRPSALVEGLVNGGAVSGYEAALTARAVTDVHRVYMRTATIFVAPHDPGLERRSARVVQPRERHPIAAEPSSPTAPASSQLRPRGGD